MVTVYRMNDYSFVASHLTLEETNSWYEKEFEENDIEDVKEINIDTEGMWYLLVDNDRIEKFLNQGISESMTENKFGSMMTRNYNNVYEFVSFREALKRDGEYTIPYEIASTEF